MKTVTNVNGKPAIRVKAELINESHSAHLLNCEGDKCWFPKNTVRDNKDGTWDIQEWIYKQKLES